MVIDEFQRQPALFPLLRVLADRRPLPARFLVLGSASPALVQGVSESLAGRVAYVHVSGVTLEEVSAEQMPQLWIRGFPEAFLAADEDASYAWRRHFMQTFLERDILQLGLRVPTQALPAD